MIRIKWQEIGALGGGVSATGVFLKTQEKVTSYFQVSVAVGWFHTARRGPQSGPFVAPPGMPSDLGYTEKRKNKH